MRHKRFAFLSIIVMGAIFVGLGTSALSARRNVSVKTVGASSTDLSAPSNVDVGIAARATDVRFSYEIVNPSTTRTVAITNVATTCGCTSAEPMERTLAPGQTTVVEGEIAAMQNTGSFEVRVRLEDFFGGVTDTNLTLRTVDPLPDSAIADGDGVLRLPIDPLYHADQYEWRAYAASNDEKLPVAFEVGESGSKLAVTTHKGVDEIVVLFIGKEGKRTRLMQRVAVSHEN